MNQFDLTDGALAQELAQLQRLRLREVGIRFNQVYAASPRRVEHCTHIGRRCERLFAKHVFTRVDRAERPLGMQRIRDGDVDGVDAIVCEERFVVGECARNFVFRGEALRFLCTAARHGDNHSFRRGAHSGHEIS